MSQQAQSHHPSTPVVVDPPPYGGADGYRAHMLEQYKHFVDITAKYWAHIAPANQFFLSLHTVILSAFTYILTSDVRIPSLFLVVLTVLSSGAALQWLMLLRSLQKINQARHEIIQEWEMHLPARPYSAEYSKLYEAPMRFRYFRIQKLYMLIPTLVILTYLGLAIAIALDVRFVAPALP